MCGRLHNTPKPHCGHLHKPGWHGVLVYFADIVLTKSYCTGLFEPRVDMSLFLITICLILLMVEGFCKKFRTA